MPTVLTVTPVTVRNLGEATESPSALTATVASISSRPGLFPGATTFPGATVFPSIPLITKVE